MAEIAVAYACGSKDHGVHRQADGRQMPNKGGKNGVVDEDAEMVTRFKWSVPALAARRRG